MKVQTSDWPLGPQADCIKAFAERVLELTDRYSIDSYRHRTLSTSDKADELSKWVGNVRGRLVPKSTLGKMIEEYDVSLVSDPVVNEICRVVDLPIESLRFKIDSSLEKMDAALKLYSSLIFPRYNSTAIDLVRETAITGLKGKRQMIRLAEHYIPHLISTGKSREFIHISVKREFFVCPGDVHEEERLKGFFVEVSRQEKRYEVLVHCESDFARYICDFTKKGELGRGELPNYFKYITNSSGGRYVQFSYLGVDPFSAVRSLKFLITLLQSFSVVFPAKKRFRPVRMMYTYDRDTGEVYKVSPEEFLNMGLAIRDSEKRLRSMEGLVKFAFGKPSEESEEVERSTFQIVNALITASSASQMSNHSACLASLWSAFEGLLPTPMKDGEKATRIIHFAEIITPLATTFYVQELFRGMYSDLARNYPSEFYSFIDKNGIGEDRFEKFLSIFYLSGGLQREFTKIFSNSHVLRMRAMTLCELANSPNKLRRAMDAHDKRVLWQVHRVYRERNDIMHSAASSKYARSLIENTFSYFKGMILTLIRASDKFGIRDLDSLIELCVSLNKRHIEVMKKFEESQGNEALLHAVRGAIQ